MSAATGRPAGVPTPDALDCEPRLMPDGSIDWHWFYEQVKILEAWRDANLCIGCGKRERTRGAAVCHSGDCEDIGIKERTGACAFCGGTRKLNSGWGGPTMPLFLERCDDCLGLRVPTRNRAVGQARMF